LTPVVIGDATLYLGDCLEILPTLGPVDAVVTDPPYGIGVEYGQFDDTPENVRLLAEKWLPLARSISGRVVLTPGNANMHSYPRPTWTLAWITPAGAGSGPWGFSCWQPILAYGHDPFLSSGKGRAPDIIQLTESSEKNGHPCPKPIGFMQRLLIRTTMEAETVLDPFMGSGTTGVACARLGRRFIGIEIEPRYFDIACKRIKREYDQLALFPSVEKRETVQMELGVTK
jgi:site-specific DNA-methyltransferase (adenine-specific)